MTKAVYCLLGRSIACTIKAELVTLKKMKPIFLQVKFNPKHLTLDFKKTEEINTTSVITAFLES